MKTTNAKELNEQYKDCPTQEQEFEIEGRKYIIISHYKGKKDLDEVVYRNAHRNTLPTLKY